MAITTLDQMVAALPGQRLRLLKAASAAMVVGQFYSAWLLAGAPGTGVAPSSGVAGDVPTSATVGAFPFTNPAGGGGSLSYLHQLLVSPTVAGMVTIYDRLWHNSGLSPTSLAAQAVASVALPARTPVPADQSGETFDANGHGVEAWLDVYTVMGAGSTAPTISYTNSEGVAGRTGTLQGFVTTAAVGRSFPFTLQAGDKGVRSIETYTNGATMTSGTFGLVLRRPIAAAPVPTANIGTLLDWAAVGMPVIPDNAALEVQWQAQATTAVTLIAAMTLIQG